MSLLPYSFATTYTEIQRHIALQANFQQLEVILNGLFPITAASVTLDSTTLVGVATNVQAGFEELDNAIVATELVANAAIPKSIIDAKGDLILGTAADTSARQVVGTNEHVLVADSAQTNGGIWKAIDNDSIAAAAGIVYSKLNLALGILNADVSASAAIAYSKLNLALGIVNADVSASAAIAYSKLNLATSIVNADINASAAIAYSKLNLATSILNADISASAEIAVSKLADGAANDTLVTNADGVTVNWISGLTNLHISASAAIAYSKLNLALGILNADVSASAAIAYSKLNLATSIVNADIAAAAEIAVSKLADGAANDLIRTAADGTSVEWASPATVGLVEKTIVDAKGDIIAATAADTVARLAVGATKHMALLVDSTTSTGLVWGPRVGIKMGTYTTATTTGNIGVTGVGFLPKLVICYGFLASSTSATGVSFGATDGTTSAAMMDIGTTAAANREMNTTNMFNIENTAGTTLKAFSYVSFDADGFTFNRVTNSADAYTMVWIAIG